MPASPADQIATIIAAWRGVEVRAHRSGGREFRVHQREIGHLHGSHAADLPFPVRIRRALVAAGRADAHRLFPKSGWVTHPIRSEHDVPAVVELFRLNYDRLTGSAVATPPTPMLGLVTMLADRTSDDLPA